MSRIVLFVALYASLAAQPLIDDAVVGATAGGGVLAVSLPVLVAVAAGFVCGPAESLVWALLAGMVSDALHAPPFGVGMLCFPAMTFAVRQILGERPPRTTLSIAVAAAALTFCVLLATSALRSVIGQTPLAGGPLLALAARVALGNTLAALVAQIMARNISRVLPGGRKTANEVRGPAFGRPMRA